jgi:hypothetical protein
LPYKTETFDKTEYQLFDPNNSIATQTAQAEADCIAPSLVLLPELSAAVGGAGSLHILVLGVSGVHAMYGSYGQSFTHAGFVMDQDKQYTWLTLL